MLVVVEVRVIDEVEVESPALDEPEPEAGLPRDDEVPAAGTDAVHEPLVPPLGTSDEETGTEETLVTGTPEEVLALPLSEAELDDAGLPGDVEEPPTAELDDAEPGMPYELDDGEPPAVP